MQHIRKIIQTNTLVFLTSLFMLNNSHAYTVNFESIIAPKGDVTIGISEGKNHIIRLVQREGKTIGDSPFGGATMLEWGLHDLNRTDGNGSGVGYLIFTHDKGEKIYLKFQWNALLAIDTDNKENIFLSGFWEIVDHGGTMKGLGTLKINILSEKERHWIFEGNVIDVQQTK